MEKVSTPNSDRVVDFTYRSSQTDDTINRDGDMSGPSVKRAHSTSTANSASYLLAEHPVIQDWPPETDETRELRLKLYAQFMNTFEKLVKRKLFPFKFVMQCLKIIVATIQLMMFASYRYHHLDYTKTAQISFSHMFLSDWNTAREVDSYPPSMGPLAIYTAEEFYRSINYAVNTYTSIENSTVGTFDYDLDDDIPPMMFCYTYYSGAKLFPRNQSFTYNRQLKKEYIVIEFTKVAPHGNFNSREYFQKEGLSIDFMVMKEAELTFRLTGINLRSSGPIISPDCFKFYISLMFENLNSAGQIQINLLSTSERLECHGTGYYTTIVKEDVVRTVISALIILLCGTSCVMCTRAIYRALPLRKETIRVFKTYIKIPLPPEDRSRFINGWFIMIICNDIMLIVGSIIKEIIMRLKLDDTYWNLCTVFLGTGNLLMWLGVLRYLSFLPNFNILLETMQKSARDILRFLLCAGIIYIAFTLCGYLVFGPYHFKFRTIASTSECLFSLVNGDDMFATFSMSSEKSRIVWWYSRFYLYIFISLFIYMILSIFISVIISMYESLVSSRRKGVSLTVMDQFIHKESIDIIEVRRLDCNRTFNNYLATKVCCLLGRADPSYLICEETSITDCFEEEVRPQTSMTNHIST